MWRHHSRLRTEIQTLKANCEKYAELFKWERKRRWQTLQQSVFTAPGQVWKSREIPTHGRVKWWRNSICPKRPLLTWGLGPNEVVELKLVGLSMGKQKHHLSERIDLFRSERETDNCLTLFEGPLRFDIQGYMLKMGGLHDKPIENCWPRKQIWSQVGCLSVQQAVLVLKTGTQPTLGYNNER